MTISIKKLLTGSPSTSPAETRHPQTQNRTPSPDIRVRIPVVQIQDPAIINRLNKIVQQNISSRGGMNEISHIDLINKINNNHMLSVRNKDHLFYVDKTTRICTQLKKAISYADICMRKMEDYKLDDFSTDPDSETFKALDKSIKAQYSLKLKLKEYSNIVTDDMLKYINFCTDDCERRISELLNVVSQANAVKQETNQANVANLGKNTNKKNNTDITKSIAENLNNVITDMHGAPHILRESYEEARALLTELDILEKNNIKVNNGRTAYRNLENKTRDLQYKLAEKLSPKNIDSKIKLVGDDLLFNTINKSLNHALERCKTIAKADANPVFENAITQLFQPTMAALTTMQDKIPHRFSREKESINFIIRYTETIKTNLQERAKQPGGLRDLGSVHSDVQKMSQYATAWSSYISGTLPQNLITIVNDCFIQSIYNFRNYQVFSSGITELSELSIKETTGKFTNTGRYLAQAFYNAPGPDALTECYLRGIPPKYLEKETASARLQFSKTLGLGSANEVTLCVYKAPHGQPPIEKVFKPEYPSRYGFSNLQYHTLDGNEFIEVLVRNIASSEVARYLGCQNIISSATAGTYKNQFGLFMTKAPGKTPCDLVTPDWKNQCEINEILITSKQYNNFEITKANLRHELNNLEWADVLSGQIDRHADNYLIDFDKLTGNVKVTGIDNDASFSTALTGIGIISVNALNISLEHKKMLSPYLLRTLQGKLYLDYNHSPIIDISTLDSIGKEIIRSITGINQKIVPDIISQETYNELMSIDSVKYAETLSELLPPENVQAALKRLESAKNHASGLRRNNRVISNWQDTRIDDYYNNEILDYENRINSGISDPQHANLELSPYLRDFHYSVSLA